MSNTAAKTEGTGVPGATDAGGNGRTDGLQSVDRAIAVLEILGQAGDLAVGDVAQQMGVHKSTASRLLSTLLGHGLVEVADVRGRYKLGYGIVRLAGMVGSSLDVTAQGSGICAALARQTGETVTISIRQEDLAVTIHQVSGGSTVTLDNWLGRPTPLHSTSSGKVLLAYLPEADQQAVLAGELATFTDNTVVDAAELTEQLIDIRTLGYGVAVEEYEIGLTAAAAPIFIHDGSVPYALSVSGPSFRIDEDALQSMAEQVVVAAAEISRRMGHHG